MDMLLSPAEVGAGEDGSDDKKDCGSLPHPAPFIEINNQTKLVALVKRLVLKQEIIIHFYRCINRCINLKRCEFM